MPRPKADPQFCLALVDVVDFTPQSAELGADATRKFQSHLFGQLKKVAAEHGFTLLREFGDAGFLYAPDAGGLIDFTTDLLTRRKIKDKYGFKVVLRVVALNGTGKVAEENGRVVDVFGTAVIRLFRIEKEAQAWQLLVTHDLFESLQGHLDDEGMTHRELILPELKGLAFNDSTRREFLASYRANDIDAEIRKIVHARIIDPPRKPGANDHFYPEVYRTVRESLRQRVAYIPVFGREREALRMDENFLDLNLDATNPVNAPFFAELPRRRTAEKRGRNATPGDPDHEPDEPRRSYTAHALWTHFHKGVILGKPGAGKTTILHHFTHFALNHERDGAILFLRCRDLRPHHFAGSVPATLDALFTVLTAPFLYGESDPASFDDTQRKAVADTARELLRAWRAGHARIFFDALDEAEFSIVNPAIVRAARLLNGDIHPAVVHGKTSPSSRCFVSARLNEQDRLEGVGAPVFDVRPLDNEQLRQFAAWLYGPDSALWKTFDARIPHEVVLRFMGDTPLTALLLLLYFGRKRQFALRYIIYDLILRFVLRGVWEDLKAADDRRSAGQPAVRDGFIEDFFAEAEDPAFLERNPEVRARYESLAELCFTNLFEPAGGSPRRTFQREQLLRHFARFGGEAGRAQSWFTALEKQHLLIACGESAYELIHSTFAEYLATRHLVAALGDSAEFQRRLALACGIRPFRPRLDAADGLETLPLHCGAGLAEAAAILTGLGPLLSPIAPASDLPRRCLAETESAIKRQLDPLGSEPERQAVEEEWRPVVEAADWIYRELAGRICRSTADQFTEWAARVSGTIPLSRDRLPRAYLSVHHGRADISASEVQALLSHLLHGEVLQRVLDVQTAVGNATALPLYGSFRTVSGSPQVLIEVEELIIAELLAAAWAMIPPDAPPDAPKPQVDFVAIVREMLEKDSFAGRSDPEMARSLARQLIGDENVASATAVVGPTNSVLLLDLPGHPEDKNFAYYSKSVVVRVDPNGGILEYAAPVLSGLLGSPNFMHGSAVRGLAVSPDGKRIASASYDDIIIVWEMATGREQSVFRGRRGDVNCVAWSPDGQCIVSGADDSTVTIWEVATGRALQTFNGHRRRVWSCVFSPDAKHILSASNDRTLRLWDVTGGHEILTFNGHSACVWCCAFSPDGTRIISASEDGTLKLWDAVTANELRTFAGHDGPVFACGFSSDGAWIVSASFDGTLKLWDAASGDAFRTFGEHSGRYWTCAFSPVGDKVASGSDDGTLRLWNTTTGRELRTLAGHRSRVLACAFSPDGSQVVSGSEDSSIRVWRAIQGREPLIYTGHRGSVLACAFSPDGATIISGGVDSALRLWDVASGREVRVFSGHREPVQCCAFSPDGTQVISASDDHTLKLWETASGRELRAFPGHTDRVHACAFSPDGKRIVSASSDDTFRLWEADSGHEIRTFAGHRRSVWSCAFSRGNWKIVTGSDDQTVRLWDARLGTEIRTLKGHGGSVYCCVFSPNFSRILSGGDDGRLKLWETITGRELCTFRRHAEPVRSCGFSPDGERVASASDDQTVRLWDASNGSELGCWNVGWRVRSLTVAPSPGETVGESFRVCVALENGTLMLLDLPRNG